jgi:hypothetical protein
MGPCTFLVTASVTGDKSVSTTQLIAKTWAEKGLKGFYPGGTALAFRQASNWASRQVSAKGLCHLDTLIGCVACSHPPDVAVSVLW